MRYETNFKNIIVDFKCTNMNKMGKAKPSSTSDMIQASCNFYSSNNGRGFHP
jgi:hypothetical protein